MKYHERLRSGAPVSIWKKLFGPPEKTAGITNPEPSGRPPAENRTLGQTVDRPKAIEAQAAMILYELAISEATGDRTSVEPHLMALMINTDAAFRSAVYGAINSTSPKDLDLINQILQDMRNRNSPQ